MLAARDLSDARAAEFLRPDVPVRAGVEIHRLARVTGLLYLVLAVCGMFAPIVLGSLVVRGDPTATAENILGSRLLFAGSLVAWIVIVIADIAVAVAVYLLLKPVSHPLALLAAALRLVYAAVLGVVLAHLFDAFLLLTDARRAAGLSASQTRAMALSALDTFSVGFRLALVVFGVHLLVLGVLLYRSRYVPRAIGVLLVVAGVGYVVDSIGSVFVADYGGPASAVVRTVAALGELGLTAWLLVKGVSVGRSALVTASDDGGADGRPRRRRPARRRPVRRVSSLGQ